MDMGPPSHWYACSGGGWIFRDFGVDLSPSDDVVPWLRLKPPVECNPHPYGMYTKCLSTLICYEWAYGSTLTVYACAGCSTQPYVCVDQIGQSRTRLNVLHADAVPRHRPSDDQLARMYDYYYSQSASIITEYSYSVVKYPYL